MSENKEQKSILNIYGLFGASLVLSIIPMMSAVALSTLFFIALLFWAYRLRKNSDEHSLADNHATYIIRTLWITALFSLVTMTLASIYMIPAIDYAPFTPCSELIMAQDIAALESMGMMEMYRFVEPCLPNFMAMNEVVFIYATLIAGLPLIVYMAYRFMNGVMRAMKGHRLANPKKWF